jgi:hypothetical protein
MATSMPFTFLKKLALVTSGQWSCTQDNHSRRKKITSTSTGPTALAEPHNSLDMGRKLWLNA